MKNKMRNLLKTYREMNRTVKAGMWFTLCNVLQRGIQFLITPFITRLISEEQYGLYSLFMAWMNIITVFATLNLSAGFYNNILIKYEDKIDDFTSSLQMLSTVCTIIVFGLLTIAYPIIKPIIGLEYKFIILMFFVVITQPAMNFWMTQLRMSFVYKPVLAVTLACSIIWPLLGLLIVSNSSLEGEGIVLSYVLTNVFFNLCFYIKNYWKKKVFFVKKYWLETLAFSVPLIPHYLSQIILGQADRIMINYFCGMTYAGIYTLAYQIALIMNILITGINNALTPWIYRKLKEQEFKKINEISQILVGSVIFISMLALLVSPELVMIMGGSKYSTAIWIIPPVMLSTCVIFIYCIYGTIMFFYEKAAGVSCASILGALINIILNFIFIPKFGFIAAGYTTFISHVMIAIAYYKFTVKCCRELLINTEIINVRFLIKRIVFLFVYSMGVLCIYQNIFVRYLILLLMLGFMIINIKKLAKVIKEVKS